MKALRRSLLDDLVLAGLIAACLGCGATPESDSESAPPLVERSWMKPIRFHGIPVLFEIEPGVEESIVLPGREIDLIGVVGANRRAVEHGYGSFYIDRRRAELIPEAPLWIYLPVRAGEPWRRRFADLTLIWHGDPPHHAWEQRTDMRAHWGIVNASITLKQNGRVTYRYGDRREIFYTPCTLHLGPLGRLLTGPPDGTP